MPCNGVISDYVIETISNLKPKPGAKEIGTLKDSLETFLFI